MSSRAGVTAVTLCGATWSDHSATQRAAPVSQIGKLMFPMGCGDGVTAVTLVGALRTSAGLESGAPNGRL